MRKIFIDCGAHCGCSRKKWEVIRPGFAIYSFEADPELCSMNPELINRAVWVSDGTKTFYKFGIDGGSSLLKKRADIMAVRKPNYYPLEKVSVDTFDLNEFILTNFSTDDYVVLKLDIEGAEYEVLPHLLENGGIELIKEIFIEWHDERVGVPLHVTADLTLQLNAHGLLCQNWDAMHTEHCIVKDDEERKKYHKR